MRRTRALRYALAAALAAVTVPFLAHAAFGDDTVAAPTAQVFPTRSGVGVTWDTVNASAYKVERKLGSADWQDASGALAESATSWIDTTLTPGASAEYRVVADDTVTSTAVAATRSTQAPAVGDVDLLMMDADPGDGATWLRNETATGVTVSAPADGTRTLSAGPIKLSLPAFFPGPGKHPATEAVRLTQGDRSCMADGEFTVDEVLYTPDRAIETMAGSFKGWNCAGVEGGFSVDIRVSSTKTYQALSIDPFETKAGTVVKGQTSGPLPVTVKNTGTAPVELEKFEVKSGASWAWPVKSNACPAILPIGASCTVKVEFAPDFVAFTRAKLVISDSTARGWHTASFSGQGASLPGAHGLTVTPTFTGNAIRWAALPTSGGTTVKGYFLHEYVDGVEKTHWVDGADRTTGFYTVADVRPAVGIEYALSVVNQVGEGPTGARQKAGRATQQIAFSGGDPAGRDLVSADLVNGQAVAIPDELTAPAAAVTASPDGKSLAYVTGSGEGDLWTRRVEPGGIGAPVQMWSDGQRRLTHLSWSPDGARIAFQATNDNDKDRPCVYVVAAAGGTPEEIACDVSSPSWMPDARTLVVLDDRGDGQPVLAQVDAKAGGNRVRSYGLTASEGTPARVSPDGRTVAVGLGTGVTFLGTQTGAVVSLSLGDGIKAISWSPDGGQLLALETRGQLSKIAFSSDGGLKLEPPVVLWPTGGQPAYDVTWQRLGVRIEPSAATTGPTISVAYDHSALLPGTTFNCLLTGRSISPCPSPVTAGVTLSGPQSLEVIATEPDGRVTRAFRTFTADATGPVARVDAPTFDATTAGTAGLKYSASDGAGVASYDVRYRKASYLSGFGAYAQPWTATTATSVNLAVDPGYEYCVSVRAKDKLGNVGAWSTERCFARPLDDRAMGAPTAGWSRVSWSAFYLATATQTSTYGASLTRTVSGKRFSLVATKCPTCGLVAVYAGGKYIGAVNLASSSTQRQAVLPLPVQAAVFNGTLTFTVRSPSGKGVQIDGLVVRRT
ncbi:WD40 repeat protein [Kribbella amoyensis]|uniref:WD40 repeat protein n=1 Tax=Kribbella amoyensis TaxID=996641 RepID=A0A561BSR8_9ACTN|nr:hypothetical protein [Kribbella amoyensis]TWD81927.1 WD40 repeat protein [Kribbella amoyensis]